VRLEPPLDPMTIDLDDLIASTAQRRTLSDAEIARRLANL